MNGQRINWIDHARGLSIILVVMLHSTLGVEKAANATGWMNAVISFATPFRVPAFFLISGLLVGFALRKPLREFLDKRVFTLVYLYAVWVTIQFAFKAPGMIADDGAMSTLSAYAFAYVQPFGTLWFIYTLPVLFLLVRTSMALPKLLVLALAFVAHVAPVHTGWYIIDMPAHHFLYFYAGYFGAKYFQHFVDWTMENVPLVLACLTIWFIGNVLLLHYATLPVIDIAFALCGAAALIAVAALLRFVPGMEALRWVGRNTVVIYLGFFLPMAITRTVMLKVGIIDDIGLISVIVAIAAVFGSIMIYAVTQKIGVAKFIFTKPDLVFTSTYKGLERRKAQRYQMMAAE